MVRLYLNLQFFLFEEFQLHLNVVWLSGIPANKAGKLLLTVTTPCTCYLSSVQVKLNERRRWRRVIRIQGVYTAREIAD